MNASTLLVGLALTTFVATASPVFSQQGPPPSDRANQVEALVTKAAALIGTKGKSAFADFRKEESEWFHGDMYLFVYDMNANVLLNPAFPKREGTNVRGQMDAKGKLFHNEIIKTAETKGSGWVDYMFPKPGQTEPSQKWTFVKKVMIDGTPGLVASGFYPE
jgi:cytochrome c